MQLNEQVSALFDNEILNEEADHILQTILNDSQIQQQLRHYQLIRDVLLSRHGSTLVAKDCA